MKLNFTHGLVLAGVVLAASVTPAQARDNLSIGIGINSPGPVYYEQEQYRPVYRPYYPVGYRSGRERHREYDYGYWDHRDHDGRWRDGDSRHDNGRHNGWDKH